jgi:hypothetical protein
MEGNCVGKGGMEGNCVRKGRNGRKLLRRLNPTVDCNASKRRRRTPILYLYSTNRASSIKDMHCIIRNKNEFLCTVYKKINFRIVKMSALLIWVQCWYFCFWQLISNLLILSRGPTTGTTDRARTGVLQITQETVTE